MPELPRPSRRPPTPDLTPRFLPPDLEAAPADTPDPAGADGPPAPAVAEMAAAVARALGEDWSCEPDPDDDGVAYLDGPEEMRLRLSLGGPDAPEAQRGRWFVKAVLGELAPYRPADAEWRGMGASTNKTPERIARDIRKRLLGVTHRLLRACRANRRAAHDEHPA